MNLKSLAIVLLTVGISLPAGAENLEHVQQLLSSKQCPQCDLSNAGLVFAQLENATLSGANLTRANLSRADLRGADLRGANLTGASLFGANLIGARLDGAILQETDLRASYLEGVTMDGAVSEGMQLQGAIGLPTTIGQAEDFYRWAMSDVQQKRFSPAIENFTQAIARKPDFAPAYLGRSVARVESGDRSGALKDAQQAETLFKTQGNTTALQAAQEYTQALQKANEQVTAPEKKSRPSIGQALLNLVGGVVQLLLP
ncbi:pentapeptide repeat-containing protein [Leptolyngbya sp. FACHB-36]|uniref:pentapeptide repeat-containing protein n=1 Tax=Leptolyngbya sp. FACHB-36 TaxID=2692808 RepID=UPI0016801805|nr:pentapeptide repeat-containing protein [Leptolyngbya sp. FACHB-36]MBD2021323.1 pentapeptide repeat-containing protein [Leptolyngbya sp. FACHB-36]